MLRQPRLDAPETLHHGMVRGLERRVIFRDDTDRANFVARRASLAESGALAVYAWALLSNHAHLLVRTRTRARNGIAYLWVEVLGHPGSPLAPVLGVRPQAVYQAVARGRAARTEWDGLLGN